MSHARVNDKVGKRESNTISTFGGSDYGSGKADQRKAYGFVCDLDFTHKKPWLRDGKRKNQEVGYTASVSSLFAIHLGGMNLVASIENGVLTVYPTDDVLAGHRRYYTVSEVAAKYTVDELLNAHTVNSLINGNR